MTERLRRGVPGWRRLAGWAFVADGASFLASALAAASDEPPIHIGRSGCTGFGAIEAPRSV